jgi:hypothetical protein
MSKPIPQFILLTCIFVHLICPALGQGSKRQALLDDELLDVVGISQPNRISENAQEVDRLLRKGANPNAKRKGTPALLCAAYWRYTDSVKLLLKRGARINAQDTDGNTALMFAAMQSDIALAEVLLSQGANASPKNRKGKTARRIAQEQRDNVMIALLNMYRSRSAGRALKRPPPFVYVPGFAHVLGLQIGVDPIGKVEQRIGTGRIAIGCHPNSRRIWRSKETGWTIQTDGFNYGDDHTPIPDVISFLRSSKEKQIPVLSTPPQWMGFWGKLVPGMKKAAVVRSLKQTGFKFRAEGNTLTWSENGYATDGADTYRKWTVRLPFINGRLDGIVIGCE